MEEDVQSSSIEGDMNETKSYHILIFRFGCMERYEAKGEILVAAVIMLLMVARAERKISLI